MAEQSNGAGLYKKLHAVMAEIEHVEKNGYNSFHKYQYAMAEDVIRAVRPLFVKHRLVIMPSVMGFQRQLKEGREGALTQVELRYTIADIDTGERVELPFYGEGQDNGDKAFYKAYTGAFKYFLIDLLMIPIGDDPEEDSGRHAAQPQRRVHQPQKPAQRPAQAAPPHVDTTTGEIFEDVPEPKAQTCPDCDGALEYSQARGRMACRACWLAKNKQQQEAKV